MSRLPSCLLPATVLALACAGCFRLRSSSGGGETAFEPPRPVDAGDVAVPTGYRAEVVATGLDFPTGVAFDDQGRLHVTEAGYSYGELRLEPRLVRIEADGTRVIVARGEDPPWNGLVWHEGAFYVAGGHYQAGHILRVTPDGAIAVLVDGLPSQGDHHTNGPAIGPDGWLYFGQGTATNSGVVGPDNFDHGWPQRHPELHDVPCRDVVLNGINFASRDPRESGIDKDVHTGAFVPFGEVTTPGQIIEGRLPCSGAVMRVRPEGGPLELVAWGLRNPFGLAFAPGGGLYVTDNQLDVRGSRPVYGTGDLLWRVEPGGWYGWPDYFAGTPLERGGWFEAPGEPAPRLLLRTAPGTPPPPAAVLGVHSSSSGVDFSRSAEFGYVGQAFVAQFGDLAPKVGKVLHPVGFKVVRVDVEEGLTRDFVVNRGPVTAPASWYGNGHGGLERPLGLRFAPDGRALYIADFGVLTVGSEGFGPRPGTGVIWRVVRVQ